ncbi:translesion DNA synthesis-associated protein ImuA [Alteromonas oceanisediminis]|uniref:translesion DNA synthesis-associated protein ImuA n=1 Tax=Alteromonas oceanisediminis TaxID=2836180 RepID=UPI001BDAF44A|nr:translesion DNA synthesis-associated protein ImuA [Alteromonas oceanisediminis]MBT0586734.1 translesion DNA synthesis-associated protein ImuA [Alteromonas oceanisediminis]
MSALITQLKNKQLVWQASRTPQVSSRLPTGIAKLDDALQGGFPTQGMVLIRSSMGIGELRLCLPLLQQRQHEQRHVFVIGAPIELNADALAEHGIQAARTYFVQANDQAKQLWACEQCAKSGCCHTVLLWHEGLSVSQAKRLQVAAEQGNCLLIAYQYRGQALPLPISLSLHISRQTEHLHIHIEKQRGGWPVPTFTVKHTLSSIHSAQQSPAQTSSNIVPLRAQR